MAMLRLRDEELRNLQEDIRTAQLSPTNRAAGDSASGIAFAGTPRESCAWADLGFKLKSDISTTRIPLPVFSHCACEFLGRCVQVRSVGCELEKGGTNGFGVHRTLGEEELNFDELKSKLELRFGEGNLTQNYYSLFTNRKQKFGEDLASFGAELKRLSRLA